MTATVGALRRWKWRVAVVAVVIIALVVVIATRGSASQGATYRTATVDTGDVTQSLTATGSIDSASRYDLTFQVAGTVADVGVAEGDTVEPGQVLATLDASDLEDAVAAAEDAVTQAQDTLDTNLDAQSTGTAVSSTTSGSSGSSANAGISAASYITSSRVVELTAFIAQDAPAPASDLETAEQAVKDAQQTLLDQYDVATAALQAAKDAQASATSVCAQFTAAAGDDSSTTDDVAAALAACQDATTSALTAQQTSADAQSALMDDATALNTAVGDLLAAVAASGGSDGGDTGGGDTGGTGDSGTGGTGDSGSGDSGASGSGGTGGSAPSTGSGSGSTGGSASGGSQSQSGGGSGGSTSSGSVPTAEDILANRADLAAAQADLAVAQSQLDYATLTSPVAGTVVGVGFAADDSVSAGDTTTAITVVADNSYLVQLSVSLTQARLLAVGQSAELTLLSDNQVVDGTVSSVSTVNSGNSFSQTYAVTIAVPDPGFDIRIGTATRMQITVADATDVLVVPTSAVSDAGGDATVQVVGDDGTAQTVSVVTGAVGSEYTEITSGLDKGQVVILADLSVKLSSSDDSSSSTGGLLSGLDSSTSTDNQQQFPGGGNFQPPSGGFGGGQGGGPQG